MVHPHHLSSRLFDPPPLLNIKHLLNLINNGYTVKDVTNFNDRDIKEVVDTANLLDIHVQNLCYNDDTLGDAFTSDLNEKSCKISVNNKEMIKDSTKPNYNEIPEIK